MAVQQQSPIRRTGNAFGRGSQGTSAFRLRRWAAMLAAFAMLATAAPASAEEVRGLLADGWDGFRRGRHQEHDRPQHAGFAGPLYSVPMMMGTHTGPFATPLEISSFPITTMFATYTGAVAQVPDVTLPVTFSFTSASPNPLLPDIAGITSTPPALDNSGDGFPGTFTGLPEDPAVTAVVAANTPFPGTVVYNQGQGVFVSNTPLLFQTQTLGQDPSVLLPEVDGDVTAAAGAAPFNGFQLQFEYRFMRAPFLLVIPHPSSTSLTGRTKISQNGSVLPRSRAFLDYSVLEAEDLAGGYTFHRFTPGVERAFFGGVASVELRAPIALTADSAITADAPFSEGDSQYGNASLAVKALMLRTTHFAFSGGLQMTFPTADDTTVSLADGTRILEVENESVHLMPFLGAMFDSPLFFAQMFAQFDVDVNGNSVRGNPTLAAGGPLVAAPDMKDDDRFYLDLATGLWLYRSPRPPRGPLDLVALAPTIEFHYTQGLGRPDFVQLGSLQVGAASDTIENLDVVVGGSAILPGGAFTAGVGMPITGDKTHDWEFRLLYNHAIR